MKPLCVHFSLVGWLNLVFENQIIILQRILFLRISLQYILKSFMLIIGNLKLKKVKIIVLRYNILKSIENIRIQLT